MLVGHPNYVPTIGDGLVAHKFHHSLSYATAIIVTRVSGEQDMSAEVARQLTEPSCSLCRGGNNWSYGSRSRIPNSILSIASLLVFWLPAFSVPEVPEVIESSQILEQQRKTDSAGMTYLPRHYRSGGRLSAVTTCRCRSGRRLVEQDKGVRKNVSRHGFPDRTVHIHDNLDLSPNVYE